MRSRSRSLPGTNNYILLTNLPERGEKSPPKIWNGDASANCPPDFVIITLRIRQNTPFQSKNSFFMGRWSPSPVYPTPPPNKAGAQLRCQSWGSNSLVQVIVQNKIRMVYPVSCTAVCSCVKSWGGPSKFLGVRTPRPPSGCALATKPIRICVHPELQRDLHYYTSERSS